MANINGIAHVQLCVSSMERSVPFYEKLLQSPDSRASRSTGAGRGSIICAPIER